MKRHILIITILFVCIMLSANTIVKTIFLNENNVVSKLDTFEALDKDYVYYMYFNGKKNSDILQTIKIDGYAFVPTNKDNDKRYTNIYLISDKNKYKIKTTVKFVWLRKKHQFKYLQNFKDVNETIKYGFRSDFSAINIKNGIYKIFLETYENDENYGSIYTHKLLYKNGVNIELLDDTTSAEQVNIENIMTDNIRYAIDHIKKEDDKIYFGGWAFHNNSCGNIYMAFKDKNNNDIYYKTVKGVRTDIGNYLKNSSYNCGYYMYLDYDIAKNYVLSNILLEQDGKFYNTSIDEKYIKKYNDAIMSE